MADERKPETKTTVTETRTVKPDEDGAAAYPNDKGKPFPWWLPLLLLLVALPVGYFLLHKDNGAANSDTTPTGVASGAHKDAQTGTTLPVGSTAPAMDAAGGLPGSMGSTSDISAPAATTTSADAVAGTPTTSNDTAEGSQGKNAKVFSGKDIATGGTAAASSKGEPLSDVTELSKASDRTTLVGRKVKLTDVPVQQVLTDRAYFVGAGDNAKLLVLLDKDMNAGAGPQRVKIMPGHKVSLTGILQPVPTAEIANEQYGLGKPNYDAIAKEQVYLHVTVAQQK